MDQPSGRNWNNLFLGFLIVILPFLYLPVGFKTALFVILGVLVMLFSLARVGRRQSSLFGGEIKSSDGENEKAASQK